MQTKEKVMKSVIAVFRSKTETYRFIEYMRGVGVDCNAVSTPKEAHVGCGISAKFNYDRLNVAYKITKSGGFLAFKGFYSIVKRNGVTSTVKL